MSEYSVVPLFSNPFTQTTIDIDNASLIDYCYRVERETDAPHKESGWQSGFLDLSASEIQPLLAEVNKNVEYISQLYQIDEKYSPKITSGWININKPMGNPLQNNFPHLHPGRFVSFVYYIQCAPNCGDLKLISPINDMLHYAIPVQVYSHLNEVNSTKWYVTPTEGMLLSFPSWIYHAAGPNLSHKDRISIAFNAEFQNIQNILNPKVT